MDIDKELIELTVYRNGIFLVTSSKGEISYDVLSLKLKRDLETAEKVLNRFEITWAQRRTGFVSW